MAVAHAATGEVINLNTYGGEITTAVVKSKHFEAIRVVLPAGKSLPPHKVRGPITVQCLEGSCDFLIGDEVRPMTPGSWLHLDGDVMHAVNSEASAVLLVTILLNNDQ